MLALVWGSLFGLALLTGTKLRDCMNFGLYGATIALVSLIAFWIVRGLA